MAIGLMIPSILGALTGAGIISSIGTGTKTNDNSIGKRISDVIDNKIKATDDWFINSSREAGIDIGNKSDVINTGVSTIPAGNTAKVDKGITTIPATNTGVIGTLPATKTGTIEATTLPAGNLPEKPKENKEKEEEKTPLILPTDEEKTTPTETENEENEMNGNVDFEELKLLTDDWLQKYWNREDQIRKETNEREDTAYQRAVADMKKAGINPNLVGVQPAQSGSGINNATTHNTSLLTSTINNITDKIIAQMGNDIKQSENSKDRVNDIITSGMSTLAYALIAMFLKKK